MKKFYPIIVFFLLLGYATFSQTISSNAPLCGNANLTLELSATGGTTYTWTGPNGFTSTLQKPSIKNVNWKNRGIYTVIIDGKTTLTTDVNIKDPLAFTVPKEISVCEGGTLIIEPKRSKLTDSTENDAQYGFDTPSGKRVFDYYFKIQNFAPKDSGIYKVNGYTYLGCSTTQEVRVTLNTSSNCKSILIEDLSKVKMCYGQEVIIPFTKKGNFKVGTKFRVYLHSSNDTSPTSKTPTLITEQSPIVIKNVNDFYNQTFRVLIVADDDEKTVGLSNDRFFYTSYEYKSNSININKTCDSSFLNINFTNYIDSLQWYLDGKVIKGANQQRFIAKTSGYYTVRFKGTILYSSEIDRGCIYESSPVKFEVGKINKPRVGLDDNIGLCIGKPIRLYLYDGIANTTYRWKKDGNYIDNATNSSYETLQEGKYQVEAKEGTCTAVSDTVVLKKPNRLNQIQLYPQNSFMEFDSTLLVYRTCNNQSFNLLTSNTQDNAKFQWFKNDNIITESFNNKLENVQGEGNYFVRTIFGQCESISKKIIVQFSNNLKGSSSRRGNVESCENSAINLFFGANTPKKYLNEGAIYRNGIEIQKWNKEYYSYNDMLKITQSGEYYAIGKISLPDGSICNVKTDTVKVSFSKKIKATSYNAFESRDGFFSINSCNDTTQITILNYGNGSGDVERATSYKWVKDGVILKQDSSNVLQVTKNGTYTLETIYKNGCTVISYPHKVEFNKIGVNLFTLSELICENDSYVIYPTLSDNSINTFELYKDGKIFKSNAKLYSTTISESGTYKLKVSNGKCEGTSPDFTLKVDKIPTNITPTDSVTFCAGKTVDLKASTEAGLSYIWERNGSVISQANQATLTASTDGLYKATLLRGTCLGTTPSVKLKSLEKIIPTATLTGDKKIDLDQETKLSVNLTSYAPWTFKLSDGKEYTATKSPFEITVKPLTTKTYSLSEVSNICGTGTVSGTAKIEVIILSTEEERELSVEVFPMPSSEICNWKIETPQATMVSVELIDVSGNSQFSELSNNRSQTHQGSINLTNLKAGTYFLKLQAGEKSVTRKVVKF